MKNVASLFSSEARKALEEKLGIIFSDEHDYSRHELQVLYERISDNFPYAFDAAGEPLEMGRIFEEIINVFCQNHLPI